MLQVGGQEALVVLIVALVVLGPTRLPEVARQLGQALASLRSMSRSFQAEMEAAARPLQAETQPPVNTAETATSHSDLAAAARRQSAQEIKAIAAKGAAIAKASDTYQDPEPGAEGSLDASAGSSPSQSELRQESNLETPDEEE